MSESAGAGAAGGSAASSTPGGTSVTPSATSQNSESSANSTNTGAATTGSNATNPNAGGSDDYEEVKVGSVSGRVPKQIAAALKNLERGFHTKSQEAAQKEKLLAAGKENPKEFFKQTGRDIYEFAEEVLAEKYELMAMDPRDRELKERRENDAKREATEKASKQEVIDRIKQEFGSIPDGAENATKEQLVNYYRQQTQFFANTRTSLDQELGSAFKDSGLAPDRHLLAKVAFEMRSALAKNKSLSAKDAVAKVSGEYYSGAKDTFGKMDVKRIHEIFGDEFLEKIRKYDLDQVTASAASKFGQSNKSPGSSPASENQSKKLNEIEWRKAMGIG